MSKTKIKPIDTIPGFTDDEINTLISAMRRTWDYVASDAINLAYECDGVSSVSRAEVIETVLDADRLLSIGRVEKTLYDRFMAVDFKVQDAFATHVFPHKRYS